MARKSDAVSGNCLVAASLEFIENKVASYFTSGFHPDLPAMCIGLAVIIIMLLWPKKWNSKVPSSLAALIMVLIFNHFAGLDIAVVGEIPKTLFLDERLSLSGFSISRFWDFFVPAFSIAALAMIESLLCGASAGKMKHERINGDRELVAQGVGNIIIPLFGGVPATAAIARTSVAIKAGCETRLTGVFHAGILLLSMFVLAPVMSEVPLSALAGILIVTAWRMNDWENIRFIFSHHFRTGMLKFLITMVATVFLDLTQAIIIGVAFSAFMIIVKLTDIDITIADIDSERLAEIGNTEVLILSMRGVPAIDLSGIQALIELYDDLESEGITVMLTSVQPKVLHDLEQGGLVEKVGRQHIFDSAEFAIIRAEKEMEE